MTEKRVNPDILYGMEDRPELKKAVPLAFQHIFAMFAANITVPLMVSALLDLPPADKTFLIQCALFMAGVGTLIQIRKGKKIGSGLPIVMGTSNAFIATVMSIAGTYGIGAVFASSFVGGLFEMVLGKSLPKLKKVFTPLVSGVVVVTLGVTLIPVAVKQAAGGAGNLGDPTALLLASVVLLTIVFCHRSKNRFVKSASILLGILTGFVLSLFLGILDGGAIKDASFVAMPLPLRYQWRFYPAAIIGMLFMYVATTIETLGDISAITIAGEDREPTEEEKTGGVLADGLSSALAALMNGFPNTSYTQNIGVVNLTGVFSRHVVRIGAYMLLLLAFFPKFSAVLSMIPVPVLGGASIAMFSMVAVSGFSLLGKIPFTSRNSLIIALSLGLGIGLSLVPEALGHLHQDIQLILTSGVVPSAVTAIGLDLFLPAEEEK